MVVDLHDVGVACADKFSKGGGGLKAEGRVNAEGNWSECGDESEDESEMRWWMRVGVRCDGG